MAEITQETAETTTEEATPQEQPVEVPDLDNIDYAKAAARLQELQTGQQEPTQETEQEEAQAAEVPEQDNTSQVDVPSETQSQPEEPALKARQLAVLQRQEQALKEREAKIKETEAAFEQFKALLSTNPTAALEKIGVADPGAVALDIWNTALGDEAPEDFKQKLAERKTTSQVEQLRAELEQQKHFMQQQLQQAQQQAVLKAKADEIRSFTSSIPEEYSFIRRLASHNQEEALRSIAVLTESAYQQNGQWPAMSDVAKALNEQLESDWKILSPETVQQTQNSTPTPEPVTERKSTKTINDTETKEGTSKQVKPIDLDAEDFEKRATAVFERHLAAAKQ